MTRISRSKGNIEPMVTKITGPPPSTRARRAGEVLPLGQPDVGDPARLPARGRQALDVGDRVDPDGLGPQQGLGEAEGDQAGRRAGGDDHVGPLAGEDAQELEGDQASPSRSRRLTSRMA